MSDGAGRVRRIHRRGGVAGLALVLVLVGCTGSDDRPGAPDASEGARTQPVRPTGDGPSDATADQASDDVDPGPALYRIDPSTGETEPILPAARGLREPELSPDGSQLAYESEAPIGTPQIFVLEHGTTRQLTHLPGGALEPTWSPDGSQIAFAARPRAGKGSSSRTDIFVMEADGSHIRRLVGTARNDGQPDWSPDGSRIVFSTRYWKWGGTLPRGAIWVVSLDDGGLIRLTRNHPFWGRYWGGADPAWSPDGRWIAYSRLAGSTINGRTPYAPLWVMRSDGTRERSLHPWKKRWGDCELGSSWSPDGSSIAFIDIGSGSSRIGIIDVQTRESAYLATPHPVANLSWSTEGLIASMGGGGVPEPPPVRCA